MNSVLSTDGHNTIIEPEIEEVRRVAPSSNEQKQADILFNKMKKRLNK